MRAAIFLAVMAAAASAAAADAPIHVTPRDMRAISLFKRTVACPATGRIVGASGSCAGYVVDHGVPKCAGGLDEQWNLFWQAKAASYQKDTAERALCRILKERGITDGATDD